MATWTRSVLFKNNNNSKTVGGIGVYGDDTIAKKAFIGLGTEPWNTGLNVTDTAVTFKGNKIYHSGDLFTPADIGAAAASHSHNYLPLTGGTLTGDIKYSGGGWSGGVLRFKNGDANGAGVGLGAGGLTVVGSGESVSQVFENNTGAVENLYLASDQGIVLASNMQSGWASRKTVELKTDGQLYVGTNKVYHTGNKPTLSEIGAAASSHNHNKVVTSNNGGLYEGNGDNASSTTANVQIKSWYGIGFGPSISGQDVPQNQNAVWINVRNGGLYARGLISTSNNISGGRYFSSNWYYSSGNTGWYSETHGGGWYMNDSTWIRAYGNKGVYTSGTIRGGTLESTGHISAATNFRASGSGSSFHGTSYFNTVSTEEIVANGTRFIDVRCASQTTGMYWDTKSYSSNCNIKIDGSGNSSYGKMTFYRPLGDNYSFLGGQDNRWYRSYSGAHSTTSYRKTKVQINEYKNSNILEDIKELKIFNYRQKSICENKRFSVSNGTVQLGIMVESAPMEIIDQESEKSIDLYSYSTYILNGLKEEIQERENKIDELYHIIESLSDRLGALENGNS